MGRERHVELGRLEQSALHYGHALRVDALAEYARQGIARVRESSVAEQGADPDVLSAGERRAEP